MAELPLFGINLPWFDGAYGHDLAPNELRPTWGCDFVALRAYRPLVQAAALGFSAVRVWLCENGEGIVTENGKPVRPHPQLLENIAVVQECARTLGLRIYWTLLDGNTWKREEDALSHRILSDADTCAHFADAVAAPIAHALDPALTVAVEVVNEPEALSPSCIKSGESVSWQVLARSIRRIGDAVRGARPGVRVTSGTAHFYLAQLFGEGPGLDAVDVHVYHDTGGLPSRDELAEAVGDRRILDGSLPLIAGECGIPDEAPEEARVRIVNYLFNAQRLGYEAAFLWGLDPLISTTHARHTVTGLGLRVKNVLAQVRGGG